MDYDRETIVYDDVVSFVLIYLLAIFVLANDLFWLSPWDLPVKAYDLGLVVILIGIAYYLVFKRRGLAQLSSTFTWLFVVYLFFVLVQVALAAFNYNQSLVDGLIAVRHHFYYLSFFLFLLVLNTADDIVRFMNFLSIMALIVFALALVNYSGIKLFHTQFDGKIAMRGGIVRAAVPAMSLMSMVFLWQVACWSYPVNARMRKWSRPLAVFFLGVHFFRQGRYRLFSVAFASLWLLVIRKQFKVLAGICAIGFAAIVIASFSMETNLFLNVFVSGVEDVTEQTGTAADRIEQLETDLTVFREYPLIGSGLTAIRVETEKANRFTALTRKADLGYSHWLKFYGIAGMTWLALFYLTLFLGVRRIEKVIAPKYMAITAFCGSYMVYLVVSFVTLNQLMFPHSIVPLCLVCAIIVRGGQSGVCNKIQGSVQSRSGGVKYD